MCQYKMMQPSLPAAPKAISSIYDAIKDGDWEGLLSLYATTTYDAVHSEDFARRGVSVGVHHQQQPLPPTLMTGSNDNTNGLFHEETKSEVTHHMMSSFHESYISSHHSVSRSFSSSAVHELDMIVREIVGAATFDEHHNQQTSQLVVASQPNKKTRQHSPVRNMRKTSSDPSSFDHMMISNTTSSSSRDMDWEKVMWNSASVLSNSTPSPSFVATRRDRERREDNEKGALKSMEEEDGDGNDLNTPIFEGSVAVVTPGDGGSGAGTAQHLACLLDSPFALAILIVLGVNVEARYTAFRRLAIHEAAALDSPRCLSLLMELGTKCSMELFCTSPSSSTATAAVSSSFGNENELNGMLSSSSAADSANMTLDSSLSSDTTEEGRTTSGSQRKPAGKKKLNIFSGWHKGKDLGNFGVSSLKKSSSYECDKITGNTSFPTALKVMWDAAQILKRGKMDEMEAAHYVLDRVKVPTRSMMILALQCPANLAPYPYINQSEIKTTSPQSLPYAPFHQLFQSNHRDMQSLFIKRNVDGHGNTPLHWAAFKGSLRAIDVLLSFNVDVNSRAQPSGWTPLHDAAYSDASAAVARLIAAGATVDARSHSGATPLCFAAQEDAPNSTRMLLKAGADPSMRCLGNPGIHVRANNADNNVFHSRFSGYTPLHYTAHYDAAKAAKVLLYESNAQLKLSAKDLLDITDLNEKLPIHVAVARGSALVLREILHAGARVETSSYHPIASEIPPTAAVAIPIVASIRGGATTEEGNTNTLSTSPIVITPVSSPVLKAMIPSRPITSSKPWNCLSIDKINACKHLIDEVESNWTPARHSIFSPSDRVAVVEVLRVGKRLEQVGRGIFNDLWPFVLSFCGRGWFEPVEEDEDMERKAPTAVPNQKSHDTDEEEMSQSSDSMDSSEDEGATQFHLEGTHLAIL